MKKNRNVKNRLAKQIVLRNMVYIYYSHNYHKDKSGVVRISTGVPDSERDTKNGKKIIENLQNNMNRVIVGYFNKMKDVYSNNGHQIK